MRTKIMKKDRHTVAIAGSQRRIHYRLVNCFNRYDIAECRVEMGETRHNSSPHQGSMIVRLRL
jgi:hypothetical protein